MCVCVCDGGGRVWLGWGLIAVTRGTRGVEGRRQEREQSHRHGRPLTVQVPPYDEVDRKRGERDWDGVGVRGCFALCACWRSAYTGVGSKGASCF